MPCVDVMNRSHFLTLTRLSETAFNALAHKGLLPFTPQRSTPRAQARYCVEDALLTELMLRLAGLGLERILAASAVKTAREDLWECLAGARNTERDVLIGVFVISAEADEAEVPGAMMRIPFACGAEDLFARGEVVGKRLASPLTGTMFVSATQALSALCVRADRDLRDLELASDFESLWGHVHGE